MLWTLYVLLILIGLFCNKSKAYDFGVILFMSVLAWLNTSAADYSSVYLPTYLNPFGIYDMDMGWSWLCELGARCGLYYNGFAFVITAIALVLYREFGKRVGANTSFMLALFLIYPGLMSLVQFRQFVASCVGSVAVACLWSSHGKKRFVAFAALFLLAVLLHKSVVVLAFALIPSILCTFGKRGRMLVTLAAAAIFAGLLTNWETIVVQIFGEMRTSTYLSASEGATSVSLFGGLRNALLLVLVPVLAWLCCRYMASIKGTLGRGVFEWGLGKAELGIVFLNIALLVLLPFVFLTNDFMRFERYGITLALALFAMMPELNRREPFLSCKALYVAVCFIFAYFYVANTFDSVYTPLLNPTMIPPFFA